MAVGNTASGSAALYSNTTGNYNTASSVSALYLNTTGSYNTASGYASGNTVDFSQITGSNDTFMGSQSALSTRTQQQRYRHRHQRRGRS